MERRARLLPDDPEVGVLPYLWLVYLAFVFLGPVFTEEYDQVVPWVATALTLPPFLWLYIRAYWVDGRRRLQAGLGIALLGVALSPWNTGANTYFIYAAFFAGLANRTFVGAVAGILMVCGLLAVASLLFSPTPYFWAPALVGSIAVGFLGMDQRRREQANADLRLARAEVETLARIAERDRIGHELHDLLGQSLSVVALKAELASRLLGKDDDRVAVELGDIHDVTRQALTEVRTAVRGYRAGSGAGIRRELVNARRAVSAAGVELRVDENGFDALGEHIEAEHEAVLALALREGVTNVVRHAAATTCRVRAIVEDETFGVEVADDGRGTVGPLGAGLRGMRERVQGLGGRLELVQDPGTTLRVLFTQEPRA